MNATHRIPLRVVSLVGNFDIEFPVGRNYNLGWTIRDRKKQIAHIEEVRRSGVRVPDPEAIPVIFAVSNYIATSSSVIQVQTEQTCGEVEFCLLRYRDLDLVGVASDHTDRALEDHWIPWSKQACNNVISADVWPAAEVRDHWNEVIMESFVDVGAGWESYQRCTLGEFVAPEDLWDAVGERISGDALTEGVILLSGTVVTHAEKLAFGDRWRLSLRDDRLKRQITHDYHVEVLQRDYASPSENHPPATIRT